MDKGSAEAQVMRAIGGLEKNLPAFWAGPSMWADVVQQSASLIVELDRHLAPDQIAALMAIGAVAHRQFKKETYSDAAGGGE